MSIIDKILRTRAAENIFDRIVDPSEVGADRPVEKDKAYLSIFLRSMRIVDVRRGWTKFYPAVHSYVAVPHLRGQLAEFQVVTSPSRLAELDTAHLDRVITLNQRLLGPIPYRGGDLKLEIGLFSVKSDDLAKPFLGVLETMALAAGVSFVGVAAPFIDPLKKGLELLTGSNNVNLEIGLSVDIASPRTGLFAVMRTSREAVNIDDIMVSAGDFHLSEKGKSLREFPYFVFSIEGSAERDEWFMIPEIATIYAELQEAVKSSHRGKVDDAYAAFRRTVLTSPDLLAGDAKRLVQTVEEDLAAILPAAMTGAVARSLRELRTIPLF